MVKFWSTYSPKNSFKDIIIRVIKGEDDTTLFTPSLKKTNKQTKTKDTGPFLAVFQRSANESLLLLCDDDRWPSLFFCASFVFSSMVSAPSFIHHSRIYSFSHFLLDIFTKPEEVAIMSSSQNHKSIQEFMRGKMNYKEVSKIILGGELFFRKSWTEKRQTLKESVFEMWSEKAILKTTMLQHFNWKQREGTSIEQMSLTCQI